MLLNEIVFYSTEVTIVGSRLAVKSRYDAFIAAKDLKPSQTVVVSLKTGKTGGNVYRFNSENDTLNEKLSFEVTCVSYCTMCIMSLCVFVSLVSAGRAPAGRLSAQCPRD
jgi:hypothetical protein